MSSHPTREDLLGFHLELLGDEEGREVEKHLEGCSDCRASLGEVKDMMDSVDQKLPVVESRELDPLPMAQRLSHSVATPAVVMAVSLLLSAVTDWTWMFGSVLPLIVGAGVVVWWLNGVVTRAETSWSAVGDVDWRSAILTGDEEQLRLFDGVKLSVIRSLSKARSHVAQVLTISGAVFIVSGAVTLFAGLWAPEVATQVASGRPMIVPGGLAVGVLLGGVVWASFRLARLGRSVADFMKSIVDESGHINPRPGMEG